MSSFHYPNGDKTLLWLLTKVKVYLGKKHSALSGNKEGLFLLWHFFFNTQERWEGTTHCNMWWIRLKPTPSLAQIITKALAEWPLRLLLWILQLSDYIWPSHCDKVIPFFDSMSAPCSLFSFRFPLLSSPIGFVQQHSAATLGPISSDGENCCCWHLLDRRMDFMERFSRLHTL